MYSCYLLLFLVLVPSLLVGDISPAAAADETFTEFAESPCAPSDGISVGDYSLVAPEFDDGGFLGFFKDFGGKVDFFIAAGMFEINKWLIIMQSWAVCSIFTFGISASFAEPMADVGERFYVGLDQVYDWAVMVTIFFVAFALIRGKVVHAVREFSLTYIIFGLYLAAGLSASDGFLGFTLATIDFTSSTTGSVAEITLDPDGGDESDSDPNAIPFDELCGSEPPYGVGCRFTLLLRTVLVEQPYDLLSWGADLNNFEGGVCGPVRDDMLRDLGSLDSSDNREAMRSAGEPCASRAEWNENSSSATRGAFVVVLVMLAVVPMVVIFMIIAFIGLGAQLLMVLVFTALPWALIFGLAPGYTRTIWWRWFALLFRVVAVFVSLSVFISVYIVSVGAVMTEIDNWFMRGILIQFLSIIVLVSLSKIVRGAKGTSALAGARMSHLTQGEPPVWLPNVTGGHTNDMATTGSADAVGRYRAHRMRRRDNMAARRLRGARRNARRQGVRRSNRPR